MNRAVDMLSLALLLGASAAFVGGLFALDQAEDFRAFYLLVVGALALRASTEILRPRGSS